MLLMIDNYDSFTYNLVQYLGELGQDVQVYRNDEITLEQVHALRPENTKIWGQVFHYHILILFSRS